MAVVAMKQLLEAGVHFGHQTRRWDPKMAEYIFQARNGIHIIDLQKTSKKLDEAYAFMKEQAEAGKTVLFVGTKKQAQDCMKEAAEKSGMYYVNQRWLGGMLTNFDTIQKRIQRLKDLEAMEQDGTFDVLPKKEVIKIKKEYEKLNKNLRGIREMKNLPSALVIVDPRAEETAIKEARKLKIPVFGIVDTNCDPDMVDYVIPANDDAVRAVKLVINALTNAVAEVNGNEIIDCISPEDRKKAQRKEERQQANNKKEQQKERTKKKEEKKTPEKAEVKEKIKEEQEDLNTKTLTELKAIAKDKGIKGYSTMKKADLVTALK